MTLGIEDEPLQQGRARTLCSGLIARSTLRQCKLNRIKEIFVNNRLMLALMKCAGMAVSPLSRAKRYGVGGRAGRQGARLPGRQAVSGPILQRGRLRSPLAAPFR